MEAEEEEEAYANAQLLSLELSAGDVWPVLSQRSWLDQKIYANAAAALTGAAALGRAETQAETRRLRRYSRSPWSCSDVRKAETRGDQRTEKLTEHIDEKTWTWTQQQTSQGCTFLV